MRFAILFALSALLFSAAAHAQYYLPVKWSEHPGIHTVPAAFKKESAVFVLDRRYTAYKEEGKDVFVYNTVHRIIKLLDDKGIEMFNKTTVSPGAERRIEEIRARTILPDGRVLEVLPDKIKETRDDDGKKQYVFAMEGLEKNAEVELITTERAPLSMFGTEIMQFDIPAMTADFTLVVPERYEFETKGYNGFSKAKDTLVDARRIYHAVAENIPALDDEPYSNYVASLMRIDYRLSYMPLNRPGQRMFTWDDMAKRLGADYYDYKEKDKKVIRHYLESIGVDEKDSDIQKIRKIEEAVKTNIVISQDLSGDESYYKFDKIIDKKLTTEGGFTRFFAACLWGAGIEFEAGMTTNKFNYPLDEDFENWKLLEYYLFYFPSLKMYLSPTALFYRAPFVPQPALGNKGVFAQMDPGEYDPQLISAKIRSIPPLPLDSTSSDIAAEIHFTTDMTPEIDMVHSMRGYAAMGVREVFVYMQKDKEKEIVQDILGIVAKPEDITSYKLGNVPFSSYCDNKPLTITANFQSPQLLEKAGNKYLFKIGDVIGRQTEMYQEKERKMQIDIPYPHSFNRKIVITIPEGYKLANPEVVSMNVDSKDRAGQPVMGFSSAWKLEGNKFTVSIREFYEQTHFPVSEIVPFRKVINAAADFNKAVLVLQKI